MISLGLIGWGFFCFFLGYRDQFCGKLLCSGGWDFPVTSKKYPLGNGKQCNEAAMNHEDNYPPDLTMVPTGTKCGANMVGEEGGCRCC